MVLHIIPDMRVVIDTNVIISALKSSRGASHKLLLALAEDCYVPCISVPLFIEYESISKKSGLIIHLNAEDIDVILDFILSKSSIRKVFYLWRPILKDPKDDLVLEVAVESQSKYIITFNKKDFTGCELFAIQALTPQEFMQKRGL